MPALSIVIPTKDRADLLAEALASVRAQKLGDFEVLVIDDASAQDIAGAVAGLKDERFRYLKLPANRSGAPAGRNFGVSQARGEFVIFLDSDDAIAPHCLSRRVEVMRARSELDFAVFQCGCYMNAPGDLPFAWNTFENRPGVSDLDRFLSRDNVWQTTAPIWRRAALAKFAGWNEQVPSGQDWEFHTRALIAGLKYEKFNELDCFWRRPSEARESIGKRTFEKAGAAEHARARPDTIEHVRAAVEQAGLMTSARRRMFAGMYWEATRRIAERASFREARRLWLSLFRRRLIGLKDLLFGGAFLLTGRLPRYSNWVTNLMERRWDAVAVVRRRPQYLLYRLTDAPPVVSVLMIMRDNWRTIEAAIRSVLAQQWQDFELIVVDDASRDGSYGIAQRIAATDARVRVLRRQTPNLAEALQEAFGASRGEFIARMSADATMRFGRLFAQVSYLREHPGCVLVGGVVSERDKEHQEIRRLSASLDDEAIRRELTRHNSGAVHWETAMMRRDAIEGIGGYRTGTGGPEAADLDLFQRLADVGRVANLDIALVWRPQVSSHSIGQR